MWDPAAHLTDDPEWAVDPAMRKRRQWRFILLVGVWWAWALIGVLLVLLSLEGAQWGIPAAEGPLQLAAGLGAVVSWPAFIPLLAGGYRGQVPPWLKGVVTPGCIDLRKVAEGPGIDAVRDARRAAVGARRALKGDRDPLARRVESLDATVVAMARIAEATASPSAVADLSARAERVAAVAAEIQSAATGLAAHISAAHDRAFEKQRVMLLREADRGLEHASARPDPGEAGENWSTGSP